jgi:uncharacterized protein DUF5919
MPRLWPFHLYRKFRRRVRQILVLSVLSAGSAGLVVAAWRMSGKDPFRSDLYMNIGAGLAVTLATYIVLNPLFKELRTASIIEHPRLDRDRLMVNIAESRHSVAILETWTGMLEEPYRHRFLAAIRSALQNYATVRVLLLDPDSPGTQIRTRELRHRDVQVAILDNLLHLHRLRANLIDKARDRFQVRVYTTAPSVQMYRWDDKAYISFFPVSQSTYDSLQIETYMSTPLGEFVQRRYEELWTAPTTHDLDRSLAMTLQLRSGTRDLELCDVQFVAMDGELFVTGSALLKQIARFGIGALTALRVDEDGSVTGHAYRLDEADEQGEAVYHRILDLFGAKYGIDTRHESSGPVMIALISIAEPLPA